MTKNPKTAIERTQGPFASWVRESTLNVPLFAFAVLAALTMALRRFGPELNSQSTGSCSEGTIAWVWAHVWPGPTRSRSIATTHFHP